MPLFNDATFTHDQAFNIVEATLSRVTSLPKFERARRAFSTNSTQVRIRRTQMRHQYFQGGARSGIIAASAKVGFEGGLHLPNDGFAGKVASKPFVNIYGNLPINGSYYDENGIPTRVRQQEVLAHETVHIAQALNGISIPSKYPQGIPNHLIGEEREAYDLQRGLSEFLDRIQYHDANIFDNDNQAAFTSKLIEVLKKIKIQYAGFLEDPNASISDKLDAYADTIATNRLDLQIQTLEERLVALENSPEYRIPERPAEEDD